MDIGAGITLGAGVSISIPPVIGQAMGGGYYAGQISTAGNGVADYYLVVGPNASAKSLQVWKTSNDGGVNTSSVIDGPGNTANMVAGGGAYAAAQFVKGLSVGGYTDWYMPAKNELEVCYYNLKGSTSNNADPVVNPNSVPSRASTPYTATVPAQTSAALFQTGNAESFSSGFYWTSTNAGTTAAYRQYWGGPVFNGRQSATYKTSANTNVRAVRRIAI